MPAPAERETLPSARQSGFSLRTFQKKCVDFHWHFHPELELTYIEQGTGIRHVGRSIMPYGKGDFCLIGSNLPHAYASRSDQRHGARWSVLHFNPDSWGKDFWSLPQNHHIHGLLRRASRGIAFSPEDAAACLPLLRRVEQPGSGDYPLPLLLEIFERLARSTTLQTLNPTIKLQEESIDPRVQDILRWLDENFRKSELSQAKAAARLGMSPPAFCRFFRQHTGRSFRRYVNELRIADVCANLKSSEETVSGAAYAAGFNNIANFNRRFLEILGQTPTAYRR